MKECKHPFKIATVKGLVCRDCGELLSPRLMESNGAVKDDGGKPMMHLFPPDALIGACEVMSHVVRSGRYLKGNWVGLPPERIYDSVMRHLLAYQSGELIDPDTGLPHLDHLTCDAGMLRHIVHGSGKSEQEVLLYMPTSAPDLPEVK